MKLYKTITIFLLSISILSCGGAKYDYNFDQGKQMNFREGKWILNHPYTNYEEHDAYKYAKEEFENILGDSLMELIELRQTKILQEQLPLNPTKKDLLEIKKFSNCDFLINIESKIIKDQMGNAEQQPPSIGSVTKYNEAQTRIQIYDLEKQELISESTAFGQVKVTKRADDDESIVESLFNYTTPGRLLALKTIKKLIHKYDKYRLE